MIYFYSADTTKLRWYQKPFSYSWWIKVFTAYDRMPGMDWEKVPTHVSIGLDETVGGEKLIFESYLVQMLNPFDNPPVEFQFVKDHYRVLDKTIFWNIVKKYAKRGYAILQLIDFIRLWFYNTVFGKEPKNVWFPKSSVCSEIGYLYAIAYAEKYGLSIRGQLKQYNQNFYHPMRLLKLCYIAENLGEGIFNKR